MKKFIKSTLAAVVVMTSAYAGDAKKDEAADDGKFFGGEFHGFLQFATNNKIRGISFSNNHFNVKGAILFFHNTGAYGGIFGTNSFLSKGGILFGPILGYKDTIGDFFYDINGRYEIIPSQITAFPDPSLLEFVGSVGYNYNDMKFSVGLGYSPNFYFQNGHGFFPHAKFEWVFPDAKMYVDAQVGYQTTEEKNVGWPKNHWSWEIGVAYDIHKGLMLGLRYVDTSLNNNLGKGAVVASLVKKF